VRIGNFVEVKAARIESGAKANHLAYIGDARVGAGANVGAGTITCNYDGVAKHLTDIGAGAFIGSNSALVAPVGSATAPMSAPARSSPGRRAGRPRRGTRPSGREAGLGGQSQAQGRRRPKMPADIAD
jgi:hypothetical protein